MSNDEKITIINRGGGNATPTTIQSERNEAYQTGWDDGYAEGYGKAKADAAAKVLTFRPKGENAKHFVDVLVCDIAAALLAKLGEADG